MTGASTAFDSDDLELLLGLYNEPASSSKARRLPWTWSLLRSGERAALARMIDVWIDTYNYVHATNPHDIVPPCWRHHPALATELAVQVWLWFNAHIHPQATPQIAGDYYLRHLPGFQTRLDHMLGTSPPECRRGEHPKTWRNEAEAELARGTTLFDPADDDYIHQLGELHFGFPYDSDDQDS